MKANSSGERPGISNMLNPVSQSAQRHALIQPPHSPNSEIYRNLTPHGWVGHLKSHALCDDLLRYLYGKALIIVTSCQSNYKSQVGSKAATCPQLLTLCKALKLWR